MCNENRYQIEDVEVIVEGSGKESIVMIHGWPDTASMWDPQVDAFKSKYRCVRFTLPGFDPKHERRIRSLDEMISFINQVVDLVSPGEKVILLVHDWGCLFGYQFYNRHSDKVSKIIGVDIGDTVSWIANVPLLHQLAANAYQAVLAACWKLGGKLGDEGTRRVAKFFNYPGNIDHIGCHMNYPYVAFNFMGENSYKKNISAFLPNCPFLFTYGANGPIMTFAPDWADKMSKKQGNKVVAFDSEHWVSVEQAELFNKTVLEWLGSDA